MVQCLSLYIISFSKITVFKTARFLEHIVFADTFLSLFSRQMDDTFYIANVSFATCRFLKQFTIKENLVNRSKKNKNIKIFSGKKEQYM